MRPNGEAVPVAGGSAARSAAMAAVLAGLGAAAVWLGTGAGDLGGGPASVAPASMGAHGGATAADGATRRRVAAAYGRLPLAFETNHGQQPAGVRFLARAGDGSLALTRDGATLAFGRAGDRPAAALRLRFAGSSGAASVSGQRRLPGTVSHLTGTRRVTAAPTFGRVAYSGVWPGVDAVFYGNQRRLEYDFVVAPGADPARIRMHLDGHRSARIAAGGDLVLTLGAGRAIRELAPVSYQRIGGRRRVVDSSYVLTGTGDVRIAVGAYDHSRALVIDPVLAYTTYLGGTGGGGQAPEQANAIAVDAAGNAYVTGTTQTTDFTGTATGLQPANSGGFSDAFVTKINPSGTAVLYSTYLGGSATDQGTAIAVDASGSAVVTGMTMSANFPTTPGAPQTAYGGGSGDAFVARLNPAGTALAYSTYLGGSAFGTGDSEQGLAVAVDGTGAAYVTGTAYAGFPTTPGAFVPVGSTAVRGAFATKLTAGGSLAYSTILRGTGTSVGEAIAVDGAGHAHVAGAALSDGTFPTTPGAFQTASAGGTDAFVTKLNTDGSGLLYSTLIGGASGDQITAMTLDAGGRAYLAAFVGTPATNPYPTTPDAILSRGNPPFSSSTAAALTVLSSAGTALDYSTYIGPTNAGALPAAIAVDASGTAYVVGANPSNGTIQTTPDALFPTRRGLDDGFLVALRPGASGYAYATYLGGAQIDVAAGVALDPAGDVFVTGRTLSPGLATPGVLKPDLSAQDAFVTRLDATVAPPPPAAPAVATGAASAVTASSASVAGSVDPNGLATSYVFEYGTTTSFGAISTPDGAGAGSADVAVSAGLTGLSAGTTYYYRVVATSSAGTSIGAVRTFKTGGGTAIAPVAVTQPASSVANTTAGLAGQVNPSGSPTAYTFEYGTTTSFGAITPVVQLDDANALELVTANLTGLAPDTTYYYRVVAANAGGTTLGAVQRFATGPGGVPIVTTGAASAITATSATLAGTVDAHGLQTAFTFAYGPVSAPLTAISAVDDAGAFQGPQPVSLTITGLTPGTTYLYRTVATNSAGSSIATIRSFTTASAT